MKVVIDIPKDFTGDYIADKFKDFFSRVIADIDCKGMCGRYEKEIAEMFLKAFDDSEEKISCNCQNNSNPRDNEPCCRCDSKFSENDDTKSKVTSLETIVRMADNKPYYEIKYKKVGEDYYHVGYSSFNIDNVLKWRDECFELVDVKHTNADRIRNMSDEELAEFIQKIKTTCFVDFIGYANKDCEQDKISCKDCQAKAPTILEWLQSEADRRNYEQ